MITLTDSVLLRLSAQVPEDIGAIEVNYYYYYYFLDVANPNSVRRDGGQFVAITQPSGQVRLPILVFNNH